MIPADLRDEKAIGFHGRASLFRETARLRPGTFPADPATTGAEAQRVGIYLPQLPGKGMELCHMPLLRLPVAPRIDDLFQLTYRLQ